MNTISKQTNHHQQRTWVIKQYWSHVLFYNFKVAPQLLQSFVPFTLDIFEGSAYVSIVPFKMSNIELKIVPKVRYPKPLWELNLRTYVKVDGVCGVYFLTLDASSLLAVLGAQVCFSLPYRIARCDFRIINRTDKDNFSETYNFNHQRHTDKSITFQTQYQVGEIKTKTNLDIGLLKDTPYLLSPIILRKHCKELFITNHGH